MRSLCYQYVILSSTSDKEQLLITVNSMVKRDKDIKAFKKICNE
jgi:hypothetical protein